MIITYNNPSTQSTFTIDCSSREIETVLKALINLGLTQPEITTPSTKKTTTPRASAKRTSPARRTTRTVRPKPSTDQVRQAIESIRIPSL